MYAALICFALQNYASVHRMCILLFYRICIFYVLFLSLCSELYHSHITHSMLFIPIASRRENTQPQ